MDAEVKKLPRETQAALTAQAFCIETNAVLTKLRETALAEKWPQPVACAAMLIFCRNSVPEGHPTRHALDTMLRKNFPFMRLDQPGVPQ